MYKTASVGATRLPVQETTCRRSDAVGLLHLGLLTSQHSRFVPIMGREILTSSVHSNQKLALAAKLLHVFGRYMARVAYPPRPRSTLWVRRKKILWEGWVEGSPETMLALRATNSIIKTSNRTLGSQTVSMRRVRIYFREHLAITRPSSFVTSVNTAKSNIIFEYYRPSPPCRAPFARRDRVRASGASESVAPVLLPVSSFGRDRLNFRRCPFGLSTRLGARGRAFPRARPPMIGIS